MFRSLLSAALIFASMTAAPPGFAQEQTPMTGDEFEAYTSGRTLTFGIGGTVYGFEQYLQNRRVRWSFVGEECRDGSWFETGAEICFVYDDAPGQMHCWQFFDTGGSLMARALAPGGPEVIEVEQSPDPMFCPGPEVGA